MMPTLAIMAIAVASAATTTEVRESEAARLRPASRLRRCAAVRRAVARFTTSTIAGAASDTAPTASNAAT